MIDSFHGAFSFLSNFHPAAIIWEGITFPTSEHAFQAAKTLDLDERRRIAGLSTPGKAKHAGKRVVLRPDWNDIRVGIMTEIVIAKFKQNPDLMESLLATGDDELIEGTTWGDKFWGTFKGKGENNLGKILMKVRTAARMQRAELSKQEN